MIHASFILSDTSNENANESDEWWETTMNFKRHGQNEALDGNKRWVIEMIINKRVKFGNLSIPFPFFSIEIM